ncbi:hypothetical protein FQA39_LY07868 [Lamprigera yunnana]|nr:hypothetical protein FQA39_LY07868 [Lamprigera yunnana]
MKGLSVLDPSSFSRPELAAVTYITIHLTVNFDSSVFKGFVDLDVKKIDPAVTEVVLDTSDLNIIKIYDPDSNSNLNYVIHPAIESYGSKLCIDLPKKNGDLYKIRIQYETSSKASGLQWLEPEQTAGKKYPYVFSQFQPIHARSVIPCQDTPYVKTPYRATITAPSHLTTLMSAICENRITKNDATVSTFVQKVPMSSYLIAIAIGKLEGRKIGPRSTIWTEKEVIDEAEYEFATTELQLQKAEEICGSYEWGIYDLLVLPPSFPYGGMENPCLTFVTPTLLAGDRSLANVVAHEIAHSWTGNLVTNCNWEHFWLNEGFTVFVERKILGRLTNKEEQDFDAYCGTVQLKETISELGHDNPITSLVVDLGKTHPDDSFSRVPYEKGHTFLRYLENLVGGPSEFEPFMRKYFENFKFRSLNSNDFKIFFESYFVEEHKIKEIDWNTWFYATGLPPIIPSYDMTVVQLCNKYKKIWLDWNETNQNIPFTMKDVNALKPAEIIQLLQDILESEPQSIKKLEMIEPLFKFANIKNSEIKFRWLRIGLKARWETKINETLQWINVVGRMKFVRPLYRALYAWEKAKSIAIENFKHNRQYMMHVTAYTVHKDLQLA